MTACFACRQRAFPRASARPPPTAATAIRSSRRLSWLTEVAGTKIGTWPVGEVPIKFSATPAHVGGLPQRGAPCYGEDNEYVLGELLGHSLSEIRELERDGVI